MGPVAPPEAAMTRRRLLLALVAALAVLVAVGISRRRRVSLARVGEIRKGMRQEEVEAVLGGPPGDYKTHDIVFTKGWPLRSSSQPREWVTDDGLVLVVFRDDGTVDWYDTDRGLTVGPGPSFWERLLRTIGWR
jgi:hypothetical protein